MNMLRKSALVAGLVASCAGLAMGSFDPPMEPPCRGPFPLDLPEPRVCRSILDFNQDNFVDFFDEGDFDNCFANGLPGCPSTDMNCDNFVDITDYDLFHHAWSLQDDIPACSMPQMTFHWTVTINNGCANDGLMDDSPAGWGPDYANLKRDSLVLYEGLFNSEEVAPGFKLAPWAYYTDESSMNVTEGACKGKERNFGLHTYFYIPGTTTFESDWREEFEDRLVLWLAHVEEVVGDYFPSTPGPCDPEPQRGAEDIKLAVLDFEAIPMTYYRMSEWLMGCENYCEAKVPLTSESNLVVFRDNPNHCAQRQLWDEFINTTVIPENPSGPTDAQFTALIDEMVEEGFWQWEEIDTIAELRDDPIPDTDMLQVFREYAYDYFAWRFFAGSIDAARNASNCDPEWGYYGVPHQVISHQTNSTPHVGYGLLTDYYMKRAWSMNIRTKRIIESVDFFAPTLYFRTTDGPSGTLKADHGGWADSDELDRWLVANFATEGQLPCQLVYEIRPENDPVPCYLNDGIFIATQKKLGVYRPIYPFFHWRAENQVVGTCDDSGPTIDRDPTFMDFDNARRQLAAMWHMGVDGVLIWSHFYTSCQLDYVEDSATAKAGFMDPVIRDLLDDHDFLDLMCDYPTLASDPCVAPGEPACLP